jgi:hypothetical protein
VIVCMASLFDFSSLFSLIILLLLNFENLELKVLFALTAREYLAWNLAVLNSEIGTLIVVEVETVEKTAQISAKNLPTVLFESKFGIAAPSVFGVFAAEVVRFGYFADDLLVALVANGNIAVPSVFGVFAAEIVRFGYVADFLAELVANLDIAVEALAVDVGERTHVAHRFALFFVAPLPLDATFVPETLLYLVLELAPLAIVCPLPMLLRLLSLLKKPSCAIHLLLDFLLLSRDSFAIFFAADCHHQSQLVKFPFYKCTDYLFSSMSTVY